MMKRKRKAKTPKIESLEYRVGRLELGPKDLVVVSTDMVLQKSTVQELTKIARGYLRSAGIKNKLLVFTAGLKLGVVRRK